jgi:hypothetical protein
MTMTVEQFIKLSGAEEVGGNLVIGVGPNRKFAGIVVDGVFEWTEDGRAMMAELEDSDSGSKRGRKKQEEAVVAESEVQAPVAE